MAPSRAFFTRAWQAAAPAAASPHRISASSTTRSFASARTVASTCCSNSSNSVHRSITTTTNTSSSSARVRCYSKTYTTTSRCHRHLHHLSSSSSSAAASAAIPRATQLQSPVSIPGARGVGVQICTRRYGSTTTAAAAAGGAVGGATNTAAPAKETNEAGEVDANGADELQPPEYLTEGEMEVFVRLKAEYAPTQLEVQDISGGCGSMYAINLESARFKGLTVIKQHKLVNETLKDLISKWHGVQLRTKVSADV